MHYWCSGLQALSVILGVVGAWFLAYGLRVKEGITPELRDELKLEEKMIAPSEVRQMPWLFYSGLAVITVAGAIQVGLIFSCSDGVGLSSLTNRSSRPSPAGSAAELKR